MPTESAFDALPLVAILRGLTPDRALDVARIVWDAGIRIVEVPLNSPEPFRSIEVLANDGGPPGSLIGAGTVLTVADVGRTHAAGGRLAVAPNTDTAVIRAALERGMVAMPGVATATETLAAVAAGATRLKLFPAVSLGPKHLKALSAVLPAGVGVYPVGGVGAADIYDWLAAGAAGFGFGSDIFKPDYTFQDIAERARYLVQAYREARERLAGR